jgi:thioredoxin-dependent peroxiredoxin
MINATISTMYNPLPPETTAPNFSLPDQDGTIRSLEQYRGKWVLIYFYPKDDTPGCTTQACGLRDSYTEYQNANIVVLGISKDSVKSHKKFEQKHNLPFPLLADADIEVAKQYGIWGPKKFMGREFLGMHRTSFLINPEGIIKKVYEKVNVLTHAKQILEDKEALS